MPGAGIGAAQAKLDYSKRGKNEMAVLNMATFLEYKTVGNVPLVQGPHGLRVPKWSNGRV